MGEWTEFEGHGKFRLIESPNKYLVEEMKENGQIVPFQQHKDPFTPYLKQGTKFYDAFHEFANVVLTGEQMGEFPKIFRKFAYELLENRVTAEELAQNDELKQQAVAHDIKKSRENYYELKYSEFRDYMIEYNMSALELVVATSRCLCADSVREVIRAFIGYFQTVNGFKGTNVIAIGNPASGKSFILETALSLIPQEYVHYGIMTESAFFETFDGQNLDGHIFMLGDLGGVKDDEKTIVFRDILKQLSTDGTVSRTISKGDGKNRKPIRQTVEGHPSLTYSTAHESIVNEQEKSRSVILTPQPINPRQLLIFNAVMRNHGIFWRDLDELERVKESIKGMVYCYNHEKDGDFFNPYMYSIEDTLKDNDDFNRKIQEYDATLEVATRLDKPYTITHDCYLDDENQKKETTLVFSTKRNNLNAMNLFDAVNFLPDEARLGDKLLEYYEVFDITSLTLDGVDESKPFEERVIDVLTAQEQDWVSEDEQGVTWERSHFYNRHNGYFSVQSKYFKDNIFTVSLLKKRFRGKWFNSQKQYLSDRLYKLYEGGVLIMLGKTSKHENVYALSDDNGSKISEKIPSFDDVSKIEDCKNDSFIQIFPHMIEEWDKFIEFDSDKPLERSLTESVPALFPNLPYIRGGK